MVRSLEAQMLEMSISLKAPWHININCKKFPIGSAQRVIVEKVTKAYKIP